MLVGLASPEIAPAAARLDSLPLPEMPEGTAAVVLVHLRRKQVSRDLTLEMTSRKSLA